MSYINKAEVWTLITHLVHCATRGIVKRLVSNFQWWSGDCEQRLLCSCLTTFLGLGTPWSIETRYWPKPERNWVSVWIDWCLDCVLRNKCNTEVAFRCQEHIQVVSMAKVRFNHAFWSLPPFLSIGSACHVFVIRLTCGRWGLFLAWTIYHFHPSQKWNKSGMCCVQRILWPLPFWCYYATKYWEKKIQMITKIAEKDWSDNMRYSQW